MRKGTLSFKMAQVMIMVMEAGKAEHTCNLLADINKNGEVTKLYDYNGNELKINFCKTKSITTKLGGNLPRNKIFKIKPLSRGFLLCGV